MIEVGDLVEYDCPFSNTIKHGIVTSVIDIGGRIIQVNFGDHEDLVFNEDLLRKMA